MYGNKALPTRIYSYYCSTPQTNLAYIDEQIRLQHPYRQRLVKLVRDTRTAVNNLQLAIHKKLNQLKIELTAAEEAVEQARLALKQANARSRCRVDTEAQRKAVTELINRKKEAKLAFEVERAKCWRNREFVKGRKKLWKACKAAEKRLAAEASEVGLYWGSKAIVMQSVEPMKKGKIWPAFREQRFDGKIAVQTQNGLSLSELYACENTLVRVEPLDPAVFEIRNRKHRRTVCMLRVGSDAKKKPVWAKLSFIMHRPIPEGSRVQWVYLLRRKIGLHVSWRLQFVLARASWPSKHASGVGKIGLDVGWRLFPDRLRVAVYRDSQGNEREIAIENKFLYRWKKYDELQAIRSRTLNEIRDTLSAWKKIQGDDPPKWFVDETWTLSAWKSPVRFYRLVEKWREMAIDGDDEIFRQVEAWVKQDRHLFRWQASLKRQAIAWRDDFYRKKAIELRASYGSVKIESVDWHDLKKKDNVESGEYQLSRYYSDVAAVGRFLAILAATMPTEGMRASNTTSACHSCGEICIFNRRKLVHVCQCCGAEWDQDSNAAENLLKSEDYVDKPESGEEEAAA